MSEWERSPFCILGLAVFLVYTTLILYNFSEWKYEYFEEEIYRFRPLIYSSSVKIQEDKRKRFPERPDVFSNISARLPSVRWRHQRNQQTKKCQQFDVFVYPLHSNPSLNAQRLHKSLTESNYAASGQNNYCVFVAVLDNAEQISSLQFIQKHANDHIIYLLHSTAKSLPDNVELFSNRIFDVNGMFLGYSEKSRLEFVKVRPFSRSVYSPFLLILSDKVQNPVDCGNGVQQDDCIFGNSISFVEKSNVDFVFINSENPEFFHSAFFYTLWSGAVPIVSEFALNRLPLADLIDWDTAIVRIAPNNLSNLVSFLEEIDNRTLFRLRRKCRFYFEHYFADSDGSGFWLINFLALIRSTLSAARYRRQIAAPSEISVPTPLFNFSFSPKDFTLREIHYSQNSISTLRNANFVFNVDPTFIDSFSPLDRLWDSVETSDLSSRLSLEIKSDELFTVIIWANNRDDRLRHSIQKLNGIKFLRMVLIIWSDEGREVPSAAFWPRLHVPIYFVNLTRGSPNSKFLPFDLIDTEAVFLFDDNLDMENSLIEKMFIVWRRNRSTIVGVNSAVGFVDSQSFRGVYRNGVSDYNMILTNGAFLHRSYFVAYWRTMPKIIREWVFRVDDCEDIAMNLLVVHLSQKPPLRINSSEIMWANNCGFGDFSEKTFRSTKYLWNRSKCVEMFTEFYGYNPLALKAIK